MSRWDIDSMNEFCDINAKNYHVLNIKYVDKGYQKQLWALIKCPNINHSPYWVWWNNFRRGNRCKQCYFEENNKISWDKHSIYDYCFKYGYRMLNIDDYKDIDTTFYCYDKNNFIVAVSVSNLRRILNGKYNISKFSIIKHNKYAKYNIDLFCKLYRPEYEFISKEYLGVKELHWFRYNGLFLKDTKYKREFQCTIDNFINGNVSHPHINKSSGEIYVENLFIENNVNYISQCTFDNCKDIQVLPFDFYLPEYNTVIEYNGKQHYEPIDFFGGKKAFEYTQKHDKMKINYCIENNINVIILPYTLSEDEIKNIILNIWNP